MNLRLGAKRKLFVAYPWDIYIQSVYEDIFKNLFREWDITHGSKVTTEDKDFSQVEEFMNRNKHLYDVFVAAIKETDFFIADITGTNPNVVLELGVAIQLNKNVLIVTSDKLEELPFDISSRRVNKYSSKKELVKIIKDELSIYKKILSQNFTKHFEGFYFSYPSEGELKHGRILQLPLPKNIKNLRFKCEYKFLKDSNSHDWLGVHLRALIIPNTGTISSELVYVRSNLKLESVSFPGKRIPTVGKEAKSNKLVLEDGYKILELVIEENLLKAETPEYLLEDDKLQNENLGGIFLHAWAHNPPTLENLTIRYRNIEIISLDTMNPIQE